MYTQCPQCQTVFRVTATMLKAASGRVRCGRCAHVFSALTFLIEREGGDESAATGPTPPGGAPAGAPDAERAAHHSAVPPESSRDQADQAAPPSEPARESPDIPESMLEFSAADLSQVFVVAPAPTLVARPGAGAPEPPAMLPSDAMLSSDEDTAEHEILDIELEGEQSGEFITLEGDSVVLSEADPSVSPEYFVGDLEESDDETAPGTTDERPETPMDAPVDVDVARTAPSARGATLPSEPARMQTAKAARTTESVDAEVQREIEAAFAADPTTRAEFTLPSGRRLGIGRGPEPAAMPDEDELAPGEQLHNVRERDRRVALAWSVASGVLAFTLLAQIVHHNRSTLVRSPLLGSAIAGVYSTLGSELTPEWNVGAYELRQFGAAADTGAEGTLRVRASLLNGAEHAQPYPVLRLTLQDRFGGQVGLRDLEPREYLQAAPTRNALLGAGQRIDADIAIVDPGKDAVGFEIDVCLRAAPQRLTCANDAPRKSG